MTKGRPTARTREEVLAMHAEYMAGKTMQEVGDANDITRARVGQLFDREGLPRRTAAETAAMRTEGISDEEVIDLYKELGSVDAVLEHVPMSRALVSEIVSAIPDREAYQGRRTERTYTEPELLRAVQRAAKVKGEPLTIPGYREVAAAEGMPALGTLLAYYKDAEYPWQEALSKAGVKGNPSKDTSRFGYTPDECIEAVMLYLGSGGGRTYESYCEWRPKDLPSGPTVRSKVGWSKAVKEALDRLASHAV